MSACVTSPAHVGVSTAAHSLHMFITCFCADAFVLMFITLLYDMRLLAMTNSYVLQVYIRWGHEGVLQ